MKELLLSFKDNKTDIFIDGVKQTKVTYFRFEKEFKKELLEFRKKYGIEEGKND